MCSRSRDRVHDLVLVDGIGSGVHDLVTSCTISCTLMVLGVGVHDLVISCTISCTLMVVGCGCSRSRDFVHDLVHVDGMVVV